MPRGSPTSPRTRSRRRTETATIEAVATGFRLEHPPLALVLLDMRFRNDEDGPRWFLLPAEVGGLPVPQRRGIFGAAPVEVEGKGRAVVVGFEGAEPFQGLLLPPKGEVRLRGLPLRRQGALPAGLFPVEAVVATSVEVEGVPVGEWIGADPLCTASVDASFEDAHRLRSRYTPRYVDVSLAVEEERRMSLELELPAPSRTTKGARS